MSSPFTDPASLLWQYKSQDPHNNFVPATSDFDVLNSTHAILKHYR
jgi:hypothetical protein